MSFNYSRDTIPYRPVVQRVIPVQPTSAEILLAHAAIAGSAPLTTREYLKGFQCQQLVPLGVLPGQFTDGAELSVNMLAQRTCDGAPAKLSRLNQAVAACAAGLDAARAAVQQAVHQWPAGRRWLLQNGLSAADFAASPDSRALPNPLFSMRARDVKLDDQVRLRSFAALVQEWRQRLDCATRKRDSFVAAMPLLQAAAALAEPYVAASLTCSCCSAILDANRAPFSLMSCAHVVCDGCTIPETCSACRSPVDARFVTHAPEGRGVIFPHVSKVDAIGSYIQSELAANANLKVVVWTQFSGFAAALAALLARRRLGIRVIDGTSGHSVTVSAATSEFKSHAGPVVAILHAEGHFALTSVQSETHVVFAHPLIAPTLRTARELEMRILSRTVVVRVTEVVQVARFVAAGTLEVEMNEERTRVPWT
ncbi:hypothetical protein H9P43_006071 [Blastocladiella emersonii ATCC 22665]|nr:hypothetical protein H9P43_006071 [Blastocladiella emersonii ATCC 22665]